MGYPCAAAKLEAPTPAWHGPKGLEVTENNLLPSLPLLCGFKTA